MSAKPLENEALVLDLVQWVAEEPRPYSDVMEAWRTSCPRLTVWEDTVDRGFVEVIRRSGETNVVAATEAGRAFLAAHGRLAQ